MEWAAALRFPRQTVGHDFHVQKAVRLHTRAEAMPSKSTPSLRLVMQKTTSPRTLRIESIEESEVYYHEPDSAHISKLKVGSTDDERAPAGQR